MLAILLEKDGRVEFSRGQVVACFRFTTDHDYLQIGILDSPDWPLCSSKQIIGEHLDACPSLEDITSNFKDDGSVYVKKAKLYWWVEKPFGTISHFNKMRR